MMSAAAPSTPETILAGIRSTFASALRPDPELTICEWSDQYRVLSRVSAVASFVATARSGICTQLVARS
jgi:hypothetical protein